jgi:hypothetical protein
MSGGWICGICETANTATEIVCEVCHGARGDTRRGLKGDLVERATSRPEPAPDRAAAARMRATAHCGPGAMLPSRATWQQRLWAGADRFYEGCAAIIRSVLRALS